MIWKKPKSLLKITLSTEVRSIPPYKETKTLQIFWKTKICLPSRRICCLKLCFKKTKICLPSRLTCCTKLKSWNSSIFTLCGGPMKETKSKGVKRKPSSLIWKQFSASLFVSALILTRLPSCPSKLGSELPKFFLSSKLE